MTSIMRVKMLDLHVERLRECDQHMSHTRRILIIFFTKVAKLYMVLFYMSVLCLDQLSYIVIEDRDTFNGGIYIYILILTLVATEKGNYLAFVRGVVAPYYQHHKQGATTPYDKNLSL